jgi:phosphoenolpyruvate---glycerone phosphotransferase subunit DhaL
MNNSVIVACISSVNAAILANESSIESLDRAIGDGDHYINIRRGCDVLMAMCADLESKSSSTAFNAIGMKLLSTIGGASGPLISGFFIAMGKSLVDTNSLDRKGVAEAFAQGVESIKLRGKADVGEKTMLDVLIPISHLLLKRAEDLPPLEALCHEINSVATANMLATRDMIASKGRASFLGERALGHIDPGCKTCEVILAAVTSTLLSRQSCSL